MTKLGVIVGSTRKDSYSKQWAELIAKLYPAGTEVTFIEIAHLPLYNQDMDAASPAEYTQLREIVQAQDALLFVTPEHNRSIPAALKNAIDIASRPWGQSVWGGKTALVVGQSISPMAGFAAGQHLRSILSMLGVQVVTNEVYLGASQELLDQAGQTNEGTKAFLQSVVDAHVALMK